MNDIQISIFYSTPIICKCMYYTYVLYITYSIIYYILKKVGALI